MAQPADHAQARGPPRARPGRRARGTSARRTPGTRRRCAECRAPWSGRLPLSGTGWRIARLKLLDEHGRHHPGHVGRPYKRMTAPGRTRSGWHQLPTHRRGWRLTRPCA